MLRTTSHGARLECYVTFVSVKVYRTRLIVTLTHETLQFIAAFLRLTALVQE